MGFDRQEFYREVGIRIQVARKQRKLKQEALAEALGIPRATYANVESGRQRVTLDLAWKIAAVLKVQIDSFLPEATVVPDAGNDMRPLQTSGQNWLAPTVTEVKYQRDGLRPRYHW